MGTVFPWWHILETFDFRPRQFLIINSTRTPPLSLCGAHSPTPPPPLLLLQPYPTPVNPHHRHKPHCKWQGLHHKQPQRQVQQQAPQGEHTMLMKWEKQGRTFWESSTSLAMRLNDKFKENYRKIAQIYHPYKHRPDLTGVSPNQGEKYFRLVKNTYEFLRSKF